MSADSQGNLYFGVAATGLNGAAVMKLTPSGELGVWKDGFTGAIAGVVVDAADEDNIWVITEQPGQSIFKLAINGTQLLAVSTTNAPRLTASRAAQDGTIWVAQASNPSVYEVDILSISRTGAAICQHGIRGRNRRLGLATVLAVPRLLMSWLQPRAGVKTTVVSSSEWEALVLSSTYPFGLDVDLTNSVIYVGEHTEQRDVVLPTRKQPI
jgi:hypothetical protein